MDYEKIKCGEEELTLPIPRTFCDALELIRSDYFRYTGRRDSFLKMFLGSLYSKPFGFLFWLRIASVKKRLAPPLFSNSSHYFAPLFHKIRTSNHA